MLATPDRLAVDRDGRVCPVELKSDEGGPGWGEPGTDEVPDHHKLQSMWQSHIFGSPGGYVVRKRGSGRSRVVHYWVPYDPNIGADMIVAAEDFLDSIERNEPPEPDAARSTTETLKEINSAVDENEFADVPAELHADWTYARQEKREAIKAEALASNRLRAAMGKSEFATYRTSDGLQVVFAKRKIGKRAGYVVSPSPIDELREIGGDRAKDRDLPAGAGDGGADSEAAAPPAEEGPADGEGEAGGVAIGEDPASAAVIDELPDDLSYEEQYGERP
jgi:hypothetical protein